MKIAIIIVRTLLGALFIFSAISYFFNLMPQPELTGNVKLYHEGLEAAVFILPLVKIIELCCGIAFISGRYLALSAVIIFPIVINIVGFHIFLMPDGIPIALFVLLATLFLAYAHREKYASLFVSK
ncbi:DoxX family membrane protein [Membranihabitans marinus]|uniref:DoxX family membrane protein n=1 Tax=Membranihabitans marinus TaxID=1227546 RepID=UPI001F2E314C|nr:DoxX family membrane protein [Membranihabitans marinus]